MKKYLLVMLLSATLLSCTNNSKTEVTFTESMIPFDLNDLDRHRDIPF